MNTKDKINKTSLYYLLSYGFGYEKDMQQLFYRYNGRRCIKLSRILDVAFISPTITKLAAFKILKPCMINELI